MHANSQIKTPAPTISAEVVQRLENEWRQMRQSATPSIQIAAKPAASSK